jgi:hypothetical protein
MSLESFTADQIEVSVKGTFKTEHYFAANYQSLGKLLLNAARSEGIFHGADESQLMIRKNGFWKAVYEIRQDGRLIGKATPRGAFKRAFDIDYEDMPIALTPGGSRLRSWSVRDSKGGVLCEFLPRKSLKRGAQIRIGAELPLPLIILCYILVIRRWQEESSSAA